MVKTYDYIIELKQKSFELIDNISKLMLVLALAAFAFVIYNTLALHNTQLKTSDVVLIIIISIGMIGWWLYCNYRIKMNQIPYYRFALMFAAWGWFVIPEGKWTAIVYIIACFLEKPVKVYPEVAFDAEEIVFNSFPKKRFVWKDVQNVVLKDGLLTIDLKNNQLIQKAVDATVSKDVEQEFNQFCLEQLANTK